jgi:glycosyltransferase involved in cell wall biosynthesis
MDKVRVLFLPIVDAGNTNAQSLNVREISLRLDPMRFESTLWYEQEPDFRLQRCPGIRLLQLPRRRKSSRILSEMLAGYDIIAYMDYSPASYLFLHLPKRMRRGAKAVFHAEAPMAQMINPSRTLRFLYEGVFPRCDVYTGITDYVARDVERAIKKGAVKKNVSYILPVGVDTNFFTPPAARANPLPVVLFAGTLIERKGPQLVIEAASRFPNAKFRLVGAGREGFEAVLRQSVARLGLGNVGLEGPKTQSQMLETMRQSDIFLLPSRLEGIPKVTLEAAATGLPCVVFRDYDTPSVVDGVTGFQVGTIEEMMHALEKLIGDRSLRERMGAAARKHVENFDWDLVGQKWQHAYLEIASDQIEAKQVK